VSPIRFVQTIGVLAAVVTLLVAGFPLWEPVANAAPVMTHWYLDEHNDRGDRDRHDRGDRKERHNKPDPAVPNPNCTLIVPKNPLSADGLATPYQLVATNKGNGPCNEANADQSAFVEATILDPATGALSVYRPLVVDKGTDPAAAPVVPALPAGAVVGIWFGFQGDMLKLRGAGVDTGVCVNGLGDSLFGQFAYCNAPAFFAAANAANVTIPALGTAADGQPCPTVRDFSVVDQDQSDNVSTVYRVTADGKVAQNTAANAGIGTPLVNASDNGLLNRKIAPTLGCANFTAPDLTNGGAPVPSLALNELQAGQQAAPVALIPLNDPMAKAGADQSLAKVNLYRAGVGQPLAATPADADGPTYCTNLKTVQPPRLAANQALFTGATSPDPAMNLFDFLAARYAASLTELGCAA
jgi:hypothetical protein